MKFVSRFVLILGLFYFFILSAVLYVWHTEDQTITSAKSALIVENKIIFTKLIDLKTNVYKTGIYDYTYWDELVGFTKHKDAEWAKINLDPFLKSYHFNYIFVYDVQSNLIYTTSDQSNAKKVEKSIDTSKLDFQHPLILDYFILVDGIPAKVFQAPIEPSIDTNRRQKPSGYMVGVKLFDKTFIQEVEVFLHQKVDLISCNRSVSGDYTYSLLNSSKEEIGRMCVTLNNTLYKTVNVLFMKIVISVLVIILLSLFAFAWLINHEVLMPLQNLSIMDGLTNAYNRRYYNDTILRIIDSAKRNNKYIHYAMLDIDYFKQYNDNYGHQKGDAALVMIVDCLKKNTSRADDYVYRLGGEEFLVIFESETKEKAFAFANELVKNIEALKIIHGYSDTSQYMTISIGLVSRPACDVQDVDEIYKEADDLLYKAKDFGKNQVVCNCS